MINRIRWVLCCPLYLPPRDLELSLKGIQDTTNSLCGLGGHSHWQQEEKKHCLLPNTFFHYSIFFNVKHQINFKILFGWYKYKWTKKKKQMGYSSLAIYMWLKMEEKNVCSKYVLDFLNPELLQNSLSLPEHQYAAALASLQWPIKPQLSWKPACILGCVLHWAAKMA